MPEADVAALKAFAIEKSRDPAEGLTARLRALMACIVIPQPIQQWMIDAGAVEPLLDSIEATILAAEQHSTEWLRAAFVEYATHKPDCRGGDGERCACGYLDAYNLINSEAK